MYVYLSGLCRDDVLFMLCFMWSLYAITISAVDFLILKGVFVSKEHRPIMSKLQLEIASNNTQMIDADDKKEQRKKLVDSLAGYCFRWLDKCFCQLGKTFLIEVKRPPPFFARRKILMVLIECAKINYLEIILKISQRCNVSCTYCYIFNMGNSLAADQHICGWSKKYQ